VLTIPYARYCIHRPRLNEDEKAPDPVCAISVVGTSNARCILSECGIIGIV
jgi:hypothetical protein